MSRTSLSEKEVTAVLKKELGNKIRDIEFKPHMYGKRRIFMSIDQDANSDAIKIMREKFDARLGTISGVDMGDNLGVVYHLSLNPHGLVVNFKITDIARDSPEIKTVSNVFPAATYMELEVHDLFGIRFKGNPLKRKWIISDDWPKGQYPLRKDYKTGE